MNLPGKTANTTPMHTPNLYGGQVWGPAATHDRTWLNGFLFPLPMTSLASGSFSRRPPLPPTRLPVCR